MLSSLYSSILFAGFHFLSFFKVYAFMFIVYIF